MLGEEVWRELWGRTAPRRGMMIRGRKIAGRALAAFVALAATLLVATSATGGPGDALPDLVSDAPTGDYLQTYADPGGTNRLLLRFNGYVHNDGAGALEIRGTGNNGGQMTSVLQRLYASDGLSSRDVSSGGTVQYETADGHGHFHLHSAMQYALFDSSKSGIVAPAMKVGFCLVDWQQMSGAAPRAYLDNSNCERGRPDAPVVVMGVSSGWRDVYGSTLAFQWIDVSDVMPGSYWLASRSDPDGVLLESNEANNDWVFKSNESIVSGYVAQPVSAAAAAATPTTIDLSAAQFGQPGPVRYEIVADPRNGTLDRAVGQPFDQAQVIYTPRAGALGIDTFTVVARDSASEFPRTPARATVTVHISGPAPSVAISGAPASVLTGTAVQLTASVTGDPPGVTWSVDGVQGGNPSLGTISPAGLYTAPTAVPPDGRVTIRAASARAYADVSIAIHTPPPPAPAPTPSTPPPSTTPPPPPAAAPPTAAPTPVAPTPAGAPSSTRVAVLPKTRQTNPLSVPVLSARGRLLLVGLVSARAGTLRFDITRTGKRLGSCLVETHRRGTR